MTLLYLLIAILSNPAHAVWNRNLGMQIGLVNDSIASQHYTDNTLNSTIATVLPFVNLEIAPPIYKMFGLVFSAGYRRYAFYPGESPRFTNNLADLASLEGGLSIQYPKQFQVQFTYQLEDQVAYQGTDSTHFNFNYFRVGWVKGNMRWRLGGDWDWDIVSSYRQGTAPASGLVLDVKASSWMFGTRVNFGSGKTEYGLQLSVEDQVMNTGSYGYRGQRIFLTWILEQKLKK